MINQLLHNLLISSLISSILAVLLTLCRKLFIKNIGASWNYYAWFTIFIPWMAIWLPWQLFSSSDLKITTIIRPLNSTLDHSSAHHGLPHILLLVWLSGTLIFLCTILLNHFVFVSTLKKNSRLMNINEQEKIKRELSQNQSKHLCRMYLSTAVDSPMLCHLIKPRIYLPHQFFEHYSANEYQYVIQHELIHFQRHDLLINTTMLFLCCLSWFNPIMFFAYKYFRNAQEISCDAVISQTLSVNEKKEYGYALLKTVMNSQYSIMSCSFHAATQLKERCQMLKFHHVKPKKTTLGVGFLIATMCIATAAPNVQKHNLLPGLVKITVATSMIQPINQNENMFKGKVQLSIGNRITIFANQVLVKHAERERHEVTEFVIYGQGTLQEGDRLLRFRNATFNPNTYQLSAETIT